MIRLTNVLSDVFVDALPGTDSSNGGDDVLPSTEMPSGEIPASAGSESSLLTHEERVERLLEGVQGYIWQGDIVDGTEWSAAKTSRILSDMEDEGRITRYRIGRRKIVCLPGSEPECIRRT